MKNLLIVLILFSLTACESKEDCISRLSEKTKEEKRMFMKEIKETHKQNPLMWNFFYKKAVKENKVFKYKKEMCE